MVKIKGQECTCVFHSRFFTWLSVSLFNFQMQFLSPFIEHSFITNMIASFFHFPDLFQSLS